jgi:predicted enzyme related to lactoylglutathione lyase
MGKRTEHAPGTFSWVDLATSDGDGAKQFYGDLFGWEFEDNEADQGTYTQCRIEGDQVAGLFESTRFGPPHWNNYVTVASADQAAAKAKELGATLMMEAYDVVDAGRMAAIQDPTGAALMVWEPRQSIGATRVNDPGCLTWNELHTPDPAKALEFYTGLFGWNAEEMESGEGDPVYTVIKVGERSNGGIMGSQDGEPPNWLCYFTVPSRDGSVETAEELGGQELFRMDMEQAKFAVIADPQGAPFAVFEGEVDD